MENYTILHEYIKYVIPHFMWIVDLTINLISGIHHSCERREYTFNVLPEYSIIMSNTEFNTSPHDSHLSNFIHINLIGQDKGYWISNKVNNIENVIYSCVYMPFIMNNILEHINNLELMGYCFLLDHNRPFFSLLSHTQQEKSTNEPSDSFEGKKYL